MLRAVEVWRRLGSARAAPAAGGREGCAPPAAAERRGAERAGRARPGGRRRHGEGRRLQTPPEFAETCEREEAAALITCK